MKYFLSIIKNISKHPLTQKRKLKTFSDFLFWEFFSRYSGYTIAYPFINNSRLLIKNGMDGATGNIIFGLMEYNDMSFLLHFIRSTDLFVDIGANVGVYSVLASAVKKSRSISFEPVPDTFKHFEDNIKINDLSELVESHKLGLSDEEGVLHFTNSLDCVNHVVTNEDSQLETTEVQVRKLDDILNGRSPILMKIDVEGYETKVLAGAIKILADQYLKGIIIELNSSGDRYGFDEAKIHENLLSEGFRSYNYDPKNRELTEREGFGEYNTIYLRDIEFVRQRVESSEAFFINKYSERI